MPKRTDIHSILLIGSGPIVIGQACEFDYSGTQACKALKEEGYRVILINSNPATIMTDPGLVDATYIEPITVGSIEKIIEKEKPDALLPTMGGQTALNMAIQLHDEGILEKYGVELIGAKIDAIYKAENREQFAMAMNRLDIRMPNNVIVHTLEEALQFSDQYGFPLIIRPSFTLGGSGGGVARSLEEYREIVTRGLQESPTTEVLIDESILGWKEYELEVMRDQQDNVVIICTIENFDPMGIHTGDSITVAPAQTLTDREFQRLRNYSLDIIREIGVDTGGSNIQFAVNPENGDVVVIEMNPRVSRSSALASKATGFPIAKIAAKLAVGYTLNEISNDITKKTPASFEPSIDYVVTKIPRFAFEKFPQTDSHLGTQMKSVGEVMSIGRTFQESFQKALRSLEQNFHGFDSPHYEDCQTPEEIENYLEKQLAFPNNLRVWYLADAIRRGWSMQKIHHVTKIDPWFLKQIELIVQEEENISDTSLSQVSADQMRQWKEMGYSDISLAHLMNSTENEISQKRRDLSILPVFKSVDTCAAEFPSYTPYFYSAYEQENESIPTEKKKVVILGSGPNRIGQGVEFDYCCVHAAMAVREAGYEAIMINCNPETVSTDYDTSDRLYFEPITFEDVMNIIKLENPEGVIVQMGGQTPLKLAQQLQEAGVKLLGTSFESIDQAEDREQFSAMIEKLELKQPPNGMAYSLEEAYQKASEVGYPILVRPSYVLGGRAMMIVYTKSELSRYFHEAVKVSPKHPVLIDKFLLNATEIDIDVLCDGKQAEVAGIMEHIEQAGIHSGDSACSLPPHSLAMKIVQELILQSKALAKELNVHGLLNIQFAVQDDEIYVIEVNPRASRTVPFVSKSIGHPIAKYATQIILGKSLAEIGYQFVLPNYFSVKETVFPFSKFSNVDTELGPEMKSTGEVMGWGATFEEAYLKSQIGVYTRANFHGAVFIGVLDQDKEVMLPLAKQLEELGLLILATPGTYQKFKDGGVHHIEETSMNFEDENNVYRYMLDNRLSFVINTTKPRQRKIDPTHLRRMTLLYNLPYFTTVEGASHFVQSIVRTKKGTSFSYFPMHEKNKILS